jgi:hypothetical protein
VDGLQSALDAKQAAATALTTSTTFGGDVSGTYNAIAVANDSHTHDTRYYTETEIGSRFAGTTAITGYNKTNWDTAYGWGDHAAQGYLTGNQTITLSGDVSGSGTTSIAVTITKDPVITLSGAVTGSATMTNLGNVTIATTATADPTITLAGDLTGSVTLTNLGNGTLTATVVDDSHNHVISNVDGLQTALDGKLPLTGGTITGNLLLSGADAENALTLSGTSPTMAFIDTGSEDDFYIHVNGNNFYVLRDAGGVGGYGLWDSPHPLDLEGDTNIGYLFGNRIFNDGYHPNADTLTTARTIALGGDVTGSASFNGSANITITATVANDSHAHSFNNLLNKTSGTGTYTTSGDFRAPIFYDSNDTNYYVNPASTSVLNILNAVTKSFLIDHPTKPDMKLRYACLEGPENGAYVRGRLTDGNVIELPDYWVGLVHEDSITVSLTPVGRKQDLYVVGIHDNEIYISGENVDCFYVVYGERKDVERLVVEF